MSAIAAETATVFRGGRRRYFTRKAAERAEARAAINKRCECDKPDPFKQYPGYTCPLHSDPVKYQRRVHLMVAMFIRPKRRAVLEGK